MDDVWFLRWTRRGLAMTTGSGVASVFFLNEPDGADARRRRKNRKKRKRKKRREEPLPCLALLETCDVGGQQLCCPELQCDQTVVADVAGTFCCQPEGAACETADPCCSRSCDFLVDGGSCSPCQGRSCGVDRPCCGGQVCTDGYCGGCRDRATSCSSPAQCCFSDCTGGACLSNMGGPCARDVDCRKCYLNHLCENACVDTICTV